MSLPEMCGLAIIVIYVSLIVIVIQVGSKAKERKP
jgi:hypothetical protein